MVVPMFALGFVVPMFAFGFVVVPGVGFTPVVPVVDRGVVVVVPVVEGVVSTVDGDVGCGLTEPGVPAVPVPTLEPVPVVSVVEGVVSTVGGVAAWPLTEPAVPAVPVPTAPVVPAWPPMLPVVAAPVVPLWPTAPVLAPAAVPAPAPAAPAPAPACAYAKQPDSNNVPVIKTNFFVITRVTSRSKSEMAAYCPMGTAGKGDVFITAQIESRMRRRVSGVGYWVSEGCQLSVKMKRPAPSRQVKSSRPQDARSPKSVVRHIRQPHRGER